MSALNVVEYRLDRLEADPGWLVVPLKGPLDDVVTAVVNVAADLEVTAHDPRDNSGDSSRKEATLGWLLQDTLDREEEGWSDVASGSLTRASTSINAVLATGDRVQSTVRITQPLGRTARLLLRVSALEVSYRGGFLTGQSFPVKGVGLAAARIEVRRSLRVLAGGQV